MEYALRDGIMLWSCWRRCSLNPCSNGICSKSSSRTPTQAKSSGLNPCSNGICSKSPRRSKFRDPKLKCLNPCSNGICSKSRYTVMAQSNNIVLILVLMEYALRAMLDYSVAMLRNRLNPCSNGICSKSGGRVEHYAPPGAS